MYKFSKSVDNMYAVFQASDWILSVLMCSIQHLLSDKLYRLLLSNC